MHTVDVCRLNSVFYTSDKKVFLRRDSIGFISKQKFQNVYEALSYLLDNIYIMFGNMLYRQIVGIPMGTNCGPLFF